MCNENIRHAAMHPINKRPRHELLRVIVDDAQELMARFRNPWVKVFAAGVHYSTNVELLYSVLVFSCAVVV